MEKKDNNLFSDNIAAFSEELKKIRKKTESK
jgi:hypothetical protein